MSILGQCIKLRNLYDVVESMLKIGNNFLSPLKKVLEKDGKKEFNKKLHSEFIDFDSKKINTKTWDESALELIDKILKERKEKSKK